MIRTILLSLSCWLGVCAASASAQFSGSDGPGPAGGRPDSTRVGALELLRGAGEAFTGLFRSDRAAAGPPEWNSTDGPRDAVMTFTGAMDRVSLGDRSALSAGADDALGPV